MKYVTFDITSNILNSPKKNNTLNVGVIFILVSECVTVSGVGVEHVGGDMFVSVPKADAIFMKVTLLI